jgi:nucleotide-binding universal stress UspA family protein
MFSKLLVPWDGTPESAVALPPARTLAGKTGASLTLMRVLPDRGSSSDQDEQLARSDLERVAREIGADGVAVELVVRRGDPAAEILAEASLQRAEMIVMGTHGRHGVERAILGSVAERVIAGAAVPVLVQRPGGHRVAKIETILVPVDGTPGGALALSAAVGLARPFGARLVLVNAVVPTAAYAWPYSGYSTYDPTWDEETRDAARAYVTGLAERVKKAGLAAEGRAPVGYAAPQIEQTADEVDADLIVMSTHALTGPARAILGSVADAVVRESQRAVLLVRRDAPPPIDS